jgi:hypothetical protein
MAVSGNEPSSPAHDRRHGNPQWAATQNNLGTTLGRLEEAVSKIDHANGEMDWLGNLVFERPLSYKHGRPSSVAGMRG